ncbi:extracellular solute-binding protein [Brucella pecoris]|uniref:Extracellular solute-binding protein n=1 Tax=Brucella pecoris TaxID=867683 RepID=A0A5C5CEB4_9HYPH|nr:extracellular solute-binding protein [Brucella pecoris]MBB4095772.1 putative spermidine/putrescine transport system substrate-binding protein [Brucella pecoris]TNV09699.1 extracellular solute-binding protein [Brucella pecoris]
MARSIKRKSAFLASLALSVSAMTVLAANAAEITVMGYRGAFQDNYVKAVIEPFQKEHPDIKVTYYGVQNAATSLGNMRAQKSSPQTDAVIYDLSVAKIADEEGLVEKLDPASLKNYADVADLGKELAGSAIPITYDTLSLLYNHDAFAESPPDSWEALWDKQQSGKVIIPAQGGGDIQAILLTIIANRLAGEDDYTKTVKPGVDKLVELAPAVQTWEPKPDAYTLVANGTATLSIGYNARAQFYFDQTGGKLQSVGPKEGTAAQVNVISAIANGKNMDATKTFIDYAISPEAQARFAEIMFYAPSNTKADVNDETKKRIPYMDTAQREKLIPVNWMTIGDMRDKLLNPWRRQIIPAGR